MAPADLAIGKTLALAAAGDQQAWRRLVEAYSDRLFGLIVRQSGDRELAQEITQATFVKIVTELERYEEQGQFESWLFRIAMNKLRDEIRRRKRQARTAGSFADPADDADGSEDAWSAIQDSVIARAPSAPIDPLEALDRDEQIARLRGAIAQLPEADRQILEMRHTAGLSFPQIAETLEQPLGTVLARGHRALAKLRKLLLTEPETP